MRSCVGALLWVLSFTMSADGQQSLSGRWQYTGGAGQQSARHAAIDTAIEPIPRLFRGRVRDRIRGETEPSPTLRITFSDTHVSLERPGRVVTLPLDGRAITVQEDGSTATLRAKILSASRLRVSGSSDGHRRRIFYQLSEDGRSLGIDVHIHANRLSQPIAYQLTYRRL